MKTIDPAQEPTKVLDLVLMEATEKPGLSVVVQLTAWIDMQEPPCRGALAWLLISAGFAKPLGEILYYASELDRPLLEIARDVDQLNLLVTDRSWQRPSDLLGTTDRARVVGLAELASLRLRAHRQRDLRIAQVAAHLQLCLSRGTL